MISEDVVRWLLEPENPSLRYRTIVELLDKSPDDPEAIECKRQIAESIPVKGLLGEMHPDGYWLQKRPRTGKMLGDGVEHLLFQSQTKLPQLGWACSFKKSAKLISMASPHN